MSVKAVILKFERRHADLARLRDLERVVIPGLTTELARATFEAAQLREALDLPPVKARP